MPAKTAKRAKPAGDGAAGGNGGVKRTKRVAGEGACAKATALHEKLPAAQTTHFLSQLNKMFIALDPVLD